MWLVVGLGNPGKQYARTRHNLGFLVVDRLVDRLGAPPLKEKWKGLTTKGVHGADELVLLAPQTYMNLSGESAQPAMAFYRVALGQVIVVHDELDLPWGEVRVKVGGGAAGHNGLKSMTQQCGGPDYVRVRMGIGRPQKGSTEAWVLGEPSPEERAELPDFVDRAVAAVLDVVALGAPAAMNAHNGAAPAGKGNPKPKAPPKPQNA